MNLIEIKKEDKQEIYNLLMHANKTLEEAMFKLKEASKEYESDSRAWRIEEDYRMDDYYRDNRSRYNEEKRYHDDFRYRR